MQHLPELLKSIKFFIKQKAKPWQSATRTERNCITMHYKRDK